MQAKLISIVGPTSVGKTAFTYTLAQALAEESLVEGVSLISADSRQVYKGLEILSGVDQPPDKMSHFLKLHGVSLIAPDEEWSVAHFQTYAQTVIDDSLNHEWLPVLVGGTGLYHEHLFTDEDTLRVPPNPGLRAELDQLSVADLQDRLARLDQTKFAAMNHSDQHNPRRLMRAIEVSQAQTQLKPLKRKMSAPLLPSLPAPLKQLSIGLRDEPALILERIQQRVLDRFAGGAQTEVAQLMALYSDWSLPAFSATGVKEIRAYLEGKISAEECLEHWALSEFQYAKRQLTWWKKRDGIVWFEVGERNWQAEAIKKITAFLN